MRTPILFLSLFFAVAAAGEALPTPEEQLRTFAVADGFEVNLFASDPQMAKPLNMNFDPQGRLWVSSSETYPQVKPGESPNDKVIILEDTTGKGVADKVTVFADKLFIPTGIVPGDGGAYVANSTQIIHFKDTDGDGKADLKRIVLDGFGTEDTHHIIHTFRWGMDGRLYFNQSIYIHSHVETPYGVKRLNAGGTWRFDPSTLQMEYVTQGMVNHWGHLFTKWGESLMTDGAFGEGINFTFPGATFATAKPDPPRILKGMTPGSPKFAACEIISGRHFPDDWQGDVITNDFRASRVVRFKLTEESSGYSAKLMPDVIRVVSNGKAVGSGNGNDRVFRPIDVKMDPDGALYIADWFNPIIQHGEVDFRDPRRDHTRGRIWRVTAKGRPLVERPKLLAMNTADLLNQLDIARSPEDLTRALARRLLIEKGPKEVLPALNNWVLNLSVSNEKLDRTHEYLEALWLYQAFSEVEPALLKQVLSMKDARARAAATRVLRDWHPKIPDALDLLAKLIQDESPRVRLEAVVALEAVPDRRSLEIALRALEKPVDASIDFALYHACNGLKPHWLPSVEGGTYSFNGNMRSLSYALQAVGSKSGVAPLLKLLKEGKITSENQENVLGLIAGLGGAGELGELLKLQEQSAEVAVRGKILNALLRAARERNIKPQGNLVDALFNADSKAELRPVGVRLAGAWKLEPLRESIMQGLKNPNAPGPQKLAALDAIQWLGGPTSSAALTEAAKSNEAPVVRARATSNLVSLDVAAAVAPAAALLGGALDGDSVAELLAAFVKKDGAAAKLTTALEAAKIDPQNAESGLRYFNASGQNSPELVQFLKTAVQKQGAAASGSPQLAGKKPSELSAAILADEKKSLAPADMQSLIADVRQHGNPARGEKIFRRSTLSCFSCHALSGAGGQVGPDLSSLGAASQPDYIIDALLSPNKTVKEGYNAYTVITKDREVFNGNIVRQTATHLILRDGTRDEILIPQNEIARKRESGSLMPSGLADSLTRGELVDILSFLASLGRDSMSPQLKDRDGQAVRRYRVLHSVPANLIGAPPAEAGKLLASPDLHWVPAYANTLRELPVEDWVRAGDGSTAFARFEVEVTEEGEVGLTILSNWMKAWLDDQPLNISQANVAVKLKKGTRVFTIQCGDKAREAEFNTTGLLVVFVELSKSTARYKIVGGK